MSPEETLIKATPCWIILLVKGKFFDLCLFLGFPGYPTGHFPCYQLLLTNSLEINEEVLPLICQVLLHGAISTI